MAKRKDIEQVVEELLQPILDTKYECVDVEYVKEGTNWYLKIYIDKEGGITIEDCEYVSRAIEKKLDENDPIESAYILEVSSPGLDRPLKKEKDFNRSIGKLVEVKLYTPLNGEKEFNAKLIDYKGDDHVVLEMESGEEVILSRKDMALIRLAVIF